jgi:hypothetical protein
MALSTTELQTVRMKETRLKVATALLLAVLSTLGVGHAAAATAAHSMVRYACRPAQNLVVTRSRHTATVQFIDRTYELRRKASSLGEKYIAKDAALIIDGKFAVFVADDRLQLGTCVEAMQVAAK